MNLLAVAWKYLKRQPLLAGTVLAAVAIASLFEGASFGMLIPLFQSMTAESASVLRKIPLPSGVLSALEAMDQRELLTVIFLLLLAVIAVKNIFTFISLVLSSRLRFDTIRRLRTALMENMLEYDIKFFDNASSGDIIGKITTETQRMGDFIKAVLRFVAIAGRVISYMILLMLISWKVSIVVFALMAVVLIPIELILKRVKKISERISTAITDHGMKLTEMLGGMRLIRAMGTEAAERTRYSRVARALSDEQYRATCYMNLIVPLTEILIFSLIVGCFLFLVNVARIDVTRTFPFIATYLVVLGKTLTQVNSLNDSRSSAMNKFAAFASYETIADEKGKMMIKSGQRKIERFSEAICFEGVRFSYEPPRRVLSGVDIRIRKGAITALVGASGAGKSTIVNLVPRFYEIDAGRITVDGFDLKSLDLSSWRKKIGFVSQDTFIFNASVRDNIAYGRAHIAEEDLIRASRAANAHDFIMRLPQGYETVLGERGVRLSGGQKQRISIARAIIEDPEILILDEATSSLDTETERLITEAIDRLTKERTVIAIAHRLSTVLHADTIVVLDAGRVVETGNHAELMASSGRYKRLYEKQFAHTKNEINTSV